MRAGGKWSELPQSLMDKQDCETKVDRSSSGDARFGAKRLETKPMGLRNHSILIVEREWTQFVRDLQAAIGHKGAITRVADGPADALLDAREFNFSVP